MARKHVYFKGMVQGVGFRYRCGLLADEYHVTGWCRNLPDGRVEAEFQGSEANIGLLIMNIQKLRYIHVESITMKDIPERKGESGFYTNFY